MPTVNWRMPMASLRHGYAHPRQAPYHSEPSVDPWTSPS